jgi:hypothetical protein
MHTQEAQSMEGGLDRKVDWGDPSIGRHKQKDHGCSPTVQNVFVVGLDDFHLRLFTTVRNAERYRFHILFSYDEIVRPPTAFSVAEALRLADSRIREFPGTVDAIVGFWDFPTSTLLPVLRYRAGLPTPSLESVLRLEHKFWARLEQRRVVPELVPAFTSVDPFARDAADRVGLAYPYWLKPIRAHSSFLGFHVRNRQDLECSLAVIREKIHLVADPFNEILGLADLPPEIRPIDGRHCIAEEIISHGRQCTLEGYVSRGRVVVYGVVDSIREGPHRSSFQRYQYPTSLPSSVRSRMVAATVRVIGASGYDNAPFNIEFYWDTRTDRLSLLEVNARISKSHCPLFQMVDGASHQQVMLETALGEEPRFPYREGAHRVAAKFMLRRFQDTVVERVPDQTNIARLQARFPEALVRIMVREGQRLSHAAWQDSYSFEIAEIFLGGTSQTELLEKYRAARAMLDFSFVDMERRDEDPR